MILRKPSSPGRACLMGLALLGLLCGCAPIPWIYSNTSRCVEQTELGQAELEATTMQHAELSARDKTLVIGGAFFTDAAGDPFQGDPYPQFYLTRIGEDADAESRLVSPHEAGTFAWLLKPGNYVLSAELKGSKKRSRAGVTLLASLDFTVEPDERAIYVGHARLKLDEQSHLLALVINDERPLAEQLVDSMQTGYSSNLISRLMSRSSETRTYSQRLGSGCQKLERDIQWGMDLCVLPVDWVGGLLWDHDTFCINLKKFGEPPAVVK